MPPRRRASERVQEYVDRARGLNQATSRGQETHDSQANANVGAIPSVAANAPAAGATGAPTAGVTSTPMTDQLSPATQGDIHQLTGQVQHLVSVLQVTLPALLAGQATVAAAAAGQPGTSSTPALGTQLPPPPPLMTMREWQRLGLKTFSGSGGAIEADDWIRYMNKKFDTMVLTTQEKCLYASQQLVGEADLWWAEVRNSRGRLADPPTWEEFTSAFAIEYYPFSLTRTKEFELDALRQQDGELVEHYEKAFREICRFLPDVNRDDQKKAWCFINGLTQEMRHVLGAHNIRSYREAVDRARAMEVQMRLTAAQKAGNQERKRSFSTEDKVEVGSSASKKTKFHGKSKPSSASSRHSKDGNHSFSPGASKGKLVCYRCGGEHKGNECGFSSTCDFCGTRGHKAIVCKKNPKTILPSGLLNKFKASSGTANQLALTSPPETRREGVPPVPFPPSVPVIPEGADLRLYSLPTQETHRRLDVVTGSHVGT